nr:hypothetical protein B0A51_05729 [Rachicladosporium sp. CCFEE 5018]
MRKTWATPALDELADAAKFKIAPSFLTLPSELRLLIYHMIYADVLGQEWEAQLNSAQTVQTNITADAFSQRLTADRAVRNLALSAEERQSYMSEIREKHKDTQQRLEDLKALLFFAGWMGQALFYWPRAFPGLYDEDENLDILMVFGDNKDNMDDKL